MSSLQAALAEVRSKAWSDAHQAYVKEQELLREHSALTAEYASRPHDVLRESDYESWSKCPFCGARNGLYGRPLEQHRTRCFYRGDANTRSVMVFNHSQMIAEDDPTFLAMMRAWQELPLAEKTIAKLEKENAALEWAVLDKECQLAEYYQMDELRTKHAALYERIMSRQKTEKAPKKMKK